MKEENNIGYYNVLKEPIVELLKEYRKHFLKQRGYDMTPRDFDNWVGGFFSGLTINKDELRNDIENNLQIINNLEKFLTESDTAKEIGVTGTQERILKEIKNICG